MVLSSEDTKLRNLKKQFQDSDKIHKGNKEWLKEFIGYNDRLGASSPGTKANYVQAIKDILEHNQVNILQLEENSHQELENLNLEIIKQISGSAYRKEDGDFSKRRKRHFWTAWKRALETQGIDTSKSKQYIPETNFTSDMDSSERHAQTHPDDLPTSKQVQKFLQTLEQVSHRKTSLRNQALVLFIWDTGTRIGEALQTQMKHINISNNRIHVKIQGNKGSNNRKIEIFQGRKTLKDYIEQHPQRTNPEAYLFPKTYRNSWTEKLSTPTLREKINQAQAVSDLQFKTRGEPFHIFRKGMTTYYKVNEILDWEEICERQGKSPDGTMPTYLKMAMEDIDSKAAEGFGLNNEEREDDHRMRQPPLLPRECKSCSEKSRCYKENCTSCGNTLQNNTMPQNLKEEKSKDAVRKELIEQNKRLIELAEKAGADIDEI